MSRFTIGQRVRCIESCSPLAGLELTVRSIHGDGGFYGVTPDAAVNGTFQWFAMAFILVPLTDRKAEEFIENLKLLGPLVEELAGELLAERND